MKPSAGTAATSSCWLVLNAGSSSLKLRLFGGDGTTLAAWLVDAIGGEHPLAIDLANHADMPLAAEDHEAALAWLLQRLTGELKIRKLDLATSLVAIGHRVVHGGERFTGPVRIDAEVLDGLADCARLAPLHNPLALRCIRKAQELLPGVEQIALFDTAFHHDLPAASRWYALPRFCREELGIRRFGFHGLSVGHALRTMAERLERPAEELNLIVAHLGNGASMTAIRDGQSFDTSMGFTPLEGLVMGSRAGDLDPAIPEFIERHSDMDAAAIDRMLNRESGLLGLCGHRDMRDVHAARATGDRSASEAFEIYVHRIRRYLGGYAFALGRVDALVFTGGVGEHDHQTRAAVCADLETFGFHLNGAHNEQIRGPQQAVAIHATESRSQIWVLPADEEREILHQMQAMTLNKPTA